MKKCTVGFFTVICIWVVFSCGSAFGYSSIIAFGDSLSDNGNVQRATDGPIWVELLADHYSASLYDYAYYGATTGFDNPAIKSSTTGLLWQVDTYSSFVGTMPPDDTLLTVWAGANDLIQERSPLDAVSNLNMALDGLYLAGGRNFLVPNLPDIGKAPAFYYGDPSLSQHYTDWTGVYDTSLDNMLMAFDQEHPDITLYTVNVFDIFGQYAVGTPEWESLYWTDGGHPSSVAHELIFQESVAATTPVPAPATAALFTIGLGGLALLSRKRRTTSNINKPSLSIN